MGGARAELGGVLKVDPAQAEAPQKADSAQKAAEPRTGMPLAEMRRGVARRALGFLDASLNRTVGETWNPLHHLGALAFVLYMNRFQIVPEERVLSATFGDSYSAYTSKVRRWL